jgi:hypothetical protein
MARFVQQRGALALFVAAGVILALPARARDVFVDNVVGDDRRDGSSAELSGTQGGPCRTITRGLTRIQPGDRLVIANHGQPYCESVTLQAARHSGVGGRPFEIVGNKAVLDGRAKVSAGAWEHDRGDVYRFQPPRMGHLMLYLEDKPALRHVAGDDAAPGGLKPLEWTLWRGHVYFCAEQGRAPRDYDLSYSALPVGITLYDVHHVWISDLVVQGFQLDGVNAHDNVVEATLLGLTCRGNGRSGISVGGASSVRVKACVLGDNGAAQLRTEGVSKTEIVDCDLIENTAPGVVREGGFVTMAPQ